MKKTSRDGGYLIHRSLKRSLIRLGRLVKARDLSHKLQRSRSNFFAIDGRIEVEESLDIPAHFTVASTCQNSPTAQNISCHTSTCIDASNYEQTVALMHFQARHLERHSNIARPL
jgi:hypothetical protein